MGWDGEKTSLEYLILEENAAAQERVPYLFRGTVSKGVDFVLLSYECC